ncbi:MAG: energy transducer TonB [Planctomycetota bacterium]|nr:energy transducer TonB [Planctomycetota bacterium]
MSVIEINRDLDVAIFVSLVFHLGILFGAIPDFSTQAGQGGEEKLIVSFGSIELPAVVTEEPEPPQEKPLPDKDSVTTPPPEEVRLQPELKPDNPTPGTPELTAGQREDIKSRFLREVIAKIQKVKRYPESARRRSLEGTVKVEFVISSEGKILSVSIITSSGYTILDEEAVEMVKRAVPFPQIPKELKISELKLLLPIVFKLEK